MSGDHFSKYPSRVTNDSIEKYRRHSCEEKKIHGGSVGLHLLPSRNKDSQRDDKQNHKADLLYDKSGSPEFFQDERGTPIGFDNPGKAQPNLSSGSIQNLQDDVQDEQE